MPKSLLNNSPTLWPKAANRPNKSCDSLETRHRVSLQTPREKGGAARQRRAPRLDTAQARANRARGVSRATAACLESAQPSLAATLADTGRRRLWRHLLAMAALLAGDDTRPACAEGGFDLHRPAF